MKYFGHFPLFSLFFQQHYQQQGSRETSDKLLSVTQTHGLRSSPSCSLRLPPISDSHICAPAIDRSAIVISETVSEEELCASTCLRVGTFNELNPSSYDIQDHRR
ncbi:BnaC01g20570D [Brassica napus]|uniref:BnaC01g20570D protein n=1 Tax=Brassica napus TaxID=3708 RepID=A0A078G162_BRANA|nr:BnaC01g20570D [Brassica napus]